jgi:hypothetical protein
VTLASGVVNAMAVDPTGIYWTTGFGGSGGGTLYPMDGTVMRAALDGSHVTTLAAAQRYPMAIAMEAGDVYWADGQVGTSAGWIMRLSTGSGTPATFAAQQSVVDMAVDPSNLYWTASGALWRRPVSGGAATTLGPSGDSGGHLALDTANVYWGTTNGVVQVPLDGGAPNTLAPASAGVGFMTVADGNVYWAAGSAGPDVSSTVIRTPVDGGASISLASVPAGLVWIATDGTNVYFTNSTAGTVAKVPVGGGPVNTLASGQNGPRDVAVDPTSVYWVSGPAGGHSDILKLTPK